MKKYVYIPLDESGLIYDTDIQYDRLEDITDFSVGYAVVDAFSLEYYFSIEIH